MFLPGEKPPQQRFSASRRLLHSSEYRSVFADNIRVTDRYFVLLARKNSTALPRLGLAVAKKNARRAVDRNSIKRVIRESFRRKQAQIGGYDIVVLTKPGISVAGKPKMHNSLDALWWKLNEKCAHLPPG